MARDYFMQPNILTSLSNIARYCLRATIVLPVRPVVEWCRCSF